MIHQLFSLQQNFITQGGTQSWILTIVLNALALVIAAFFLKGVEVKSFLSALVIGLVLAFLNATVGNMLKFLTFPINVLTLGLLTWIINALVILLTARLMSGFKVRNFGWALALSLVLAVMNSVLFGIF